ncbi:MAG: glutamate racemase [Bacteroidales bacterium]|nr:glutamate racemase [Bacteroidales bacterium]
MIGIFDSGYGGLTILNHIRQHLPQYDYLYLGDNARAPYGTRSFDVIYEYTLQAVNYLHQQGCNLIILACNTASAKALRTIQQRDINPDELRVLGVIRPTVEVVPQRTRTKHIGVLATPGTVASESYVIELLKQDPTLTITQQACPMWVPLIESGEHLGDGANYFVEKYLTELLTRDPLIDTIILGCTHYPLLQPKIEAFLEKYEHTKLLIQNSKFKIISQGEIVARSLADYLHRHPDIAERALKNRHALEDNSKFIIHNSKFLTTESATKFSESASLFLSEPITARHIEL